MSTIQVSEEDRFKNNLLALCELIQSQLVPVNEKIQQINLSGKGKKIEQVNALTVNGAYVGVELMQGSTLVEGFIERSYSSADKLREKGIKVPDTLWYYIKDRDENFFAEHADGLFGGTGLFKSLFKARDVNGQSLLSDEIKDQIWTILRSLILISVKYVNRVRKTDNGFMKFVNVEQCIRDWNIKNI